MSSAFPLTPWSSIMRGEGLDPDARREQMRRLLGRYWRPLYSCLRLGWQLEPEAARRRVEEFFYKLLNEDLMRGLDPEKGRFREFLKEKLEEFMAGVDESAPGEAPRETSVVDLSDAETVVADAETLEMPPGEPARVFDAAWVQLLIERALEHYAEEAREDGGAGPFTVFEKVDVQADDRSLEEVAGELGLEVGQLADRLHEARKHFRRVMAQQIHDYALDDSDAREELRWTIG